MKTLHVINPNSSAHVTEAIEYAARPFRDGGAPIHCSAMADGPPGIETEHDLHVCIDPMLRFALAHEENASAFVVACFGDPGLALLREKIRRPIFGIAECGVMAAMLLGERFGVISILEPAIARHLRYFRAMGVDRRLAADRAIGLGVARLKNRDDVFVRMVETGKRLRIEDGADVILMGGAAMSNLREPLEKELGLPVIDPNAAAIAMATGFANLGWSRSATMRDAASASEAPQRNGAERP